ncbi:hypothetical protein BO78DRAFT_171834 [Aspergillus sclerotiicarbonarius CBS 121057]|uniref:Uncharacterized protein n=1 Tax=Aspergillus sclerotiicarbonarius (strain CBS 121057 / IBT 28362) TaxID=1448318 RepID=A0A319FDF5_ASPSB|nr:hypothetical protein BO78DRAFT_171834 [Aspergillus sclerotiicarbonarius CBS 121057]
MVEVIGLSDCLGSAVRIGLLPVGAALPLFNGLAMPIFCCKHLKQRVVHFVQMLNLPALILFDSG